MIEAAAPSDGTAPERMSAEEVAKVAAEHKTKCDRHAVSGSNRANASTLSVLTCALNDALVDLDKTEKERQDTKREYERADRRRGEAAREARRVKGALDYHVGEAMQERRA